MTATTPTHALETLRAAAARGALATVSNRHDVALLVAFGSAVSGPVRDHARDLDIAVLTEDGHSTLELLAELSDLTRFDAIDLLDLGRAGPVATVEALLHGDVLFEREPGMADRLLARAADREDGHPVVARLGARADGVVTSTVNPDVVVERLSRIRELLGEMRTIGVPDGETLQSDHIRRYALERLATLVVDSATALNSHISSRVLGRVATTYAETFDLVAEAGALDTSFASRIRASAKLRNLLVHDYADIDFDMLANALTQLLTDYDQYTHEVARWLRDKEAAAD